MRTGSGYERELRALLEGDRTAIRAYGRRLPAGDRPKIQRLAETPCLVVRAAGSFGFDLVALRDYFAFPLEVKSSHEETIRFSSAGGRAEEQLADHRKTADRVGLLVIYAYRRVGGSRGDSWRLFIAPGPDGSGWRHIVRKRLPEVERTRDGNGVLRWERGLPFVQFVELLTQLFGDGAGVSA
ncbi:MAG TPA: Holliday junction resolvase [Thermoplasmata archaeon]|nr:Holliday junction resolvase [Thermoplasmata archaeon]